MDECRIRFIRKFPGVSVPNKSTIHRLVCKVRETNAFADKKRNHKRTVLTQNKVDDIGACFEQSPHKSLSKLAQQLLEPHKKSQWGEIKTPYRPKSEHSISINMLEMFKRVMVVTEKYGEHHLA
ncbi:hypothetical protein C0J52_14008 [Blattella germanica]|nr:hypothetical protein C0J52_14008 [Blattella germanica]